MSRQQGKSGDRQQRHTGLAGKGAWLCLLGVMLGSPVLADSMRCGSALVTDGDSSATLLLKCGKPLLVEPLVTSAMSEKNELTQVSAGERWTYSMGSGKFIQYVTVMNGVITKIEDGPRQ